MVMPANNAKKTGKYLPTVSLRIPILITFIVERERAKYHFMNKNKSFFGICFHFFLVLILQ